MTEKVYSPFVPYLAAPAITDGKLKRQRRINPFLQGRDITLMERPSWDEYFMRMAVMAATRSNCVRRKVGAVIVKEKRIMSTGYNGPPRGDHVDSRRTKGILRVTAH